MNISADKVFDLRLVAAAAAVLLSVVSIGMSLMTSGVWVGAVETKLDAVELRVDKRAATITELRDDMIANRERLANQIGQITQLQGQVNSAQVAINALPERLGKLETMIQELIGRLEREKRQGKLKLVPIP